MCCPNFREISRPSCFPRLKPGAQRTKCLRHYHDGRDETRGYSLGSVLPFPLIVGGKGLGERGPDIGQTAPRYPARRMTQRVMSTPNSVHASASAGSTT